MQKQTITIMTHSGQIQDIHGIPEGVVIEVKAYDGESEPAWEDDDAPDITIYRF